MADQHANDEPAAISDLNRIDRIRRDFVANASHELRTPLTVLRGYLDMMYEEAGEAGPLVPWREPLDNMCQQAERMERIIGDMLILARLEVHGSTGGAERVDVAGLLGKIVRQAESLSQGRHVLRLEAEPAPRLRGSAAELEMAFSNLVLNAVQHTPAGTTISIRWHAAEGGARFSVADDGPGIPAGDIPRLTERFYRVDVGRSRASGGTGLGLAIVKHALERHDSSIEIDSRPGAGATFSCTFPPRRVDIING
ncbi:MAG TPA: ATP-binding protein [Gammaproteobacteria bacterium]|nr:ATP-binding protein [Gammaproteobacteria bacterium]